jgi:hypothetical protein
MREVASKELRAPSLWSAEGGHLHERFRCNWVRSISIPIPPKWLKSSVERLSDKSLDGPQRFVLVALKVAKMVLLGEF